VLFVWEENITAVLPEELFHFQLLAANTIIVPASQPQDYFPASPWSRSHIQLWRG
jgi:hypothetical protein